MTAAVRVCAMSDLEPDTALKVEVAGVARFKAGQAWAMHIQQNPKCRAGHCRARELEAIKAPRHSALQNPPPHQVRAQALQHKSD